MATADRQLALDDARLTSVVDRSLARSYRTAGSDMACRIGCVECCIGPFAITALDALRLRRGLLVLEQEDEARARVLRGRARRAVRELSSGFPGDVARGWLADDRAEEESFAELHAGMACPALDPTTGACELYASRPLSCRTFGPPVRVGAADLPPCRLCLVGATPDRVAACRAEPDLEGLEARIMTDAERRGLTRSETYVAFALVQWAPGGWDEI